MSEKRSPNYKGIFYLSMFILALGIFLNNFSNANNSIGFVFIVIGGIFFMISMKNRDKWWDIDKAE